MSAVIIFSIHLSLIFILSISLILILSPRCINVTQKCHPSLYSKKENRNWMEWWCGLWSACILWGHGIMLHHRHDDLDGSIHGIQWYVYVIILLRLTLTAFTLQAKIIDFFFTFWCFICNLPGNKTNNLNRKNPPLECVFFIMMAEISLIFAV